MGNVLILPETSEKPITLIGTRAGICWGADIRDPQKNYKRGLDCIRSGHGRTFEFVNVEVVLDGYSARVIREWYTHIGGSPTRLQASTRYINYASFPYVTPPRIEKNPEAKAIYDRTMQAISDAGRELEALGIAREDSAMLLPLGMETKIVDRRNLRSYIDMSRQRMCTRAYHEYRALFSDILDALSAYSEEWRQLVESEMMPKCDALGYCPEKFSCGRKPGRDGL